MRARGRAGQRQDGGVRGGVRRAGGGRAHLHLPTSPHISLHLPTSPHISLYLAQAEQLIIVGDTRQLPPTVASASAELRHALGVSPMERLERARVGQRTLRVQYRMPPELLEHPSRSRVTTPDPNPNANPNPNPNACRLSCLSTRRGLE